MVCAWQVARGGPRRERTRNVSFLSLSMGLPIISDDAFSLRVNRAWFRLFAILDKH